MRTLAQQAIEKIKTCNQKKNDLIDKLKSSHEDKILQMKIIINCLENINKAILDQKREVYVSLYGFDISGSLVNKIQSYFVAQNYQVQFKYCVITSDNLQKIKPTCIIFSW